MGKRDGYIKVSRCIGDHWIWNDEPFDRAHAWIDLLLLANYKDAKTIYQGQIITLKKGTVNRSLRFLANRWGWSVRKVSNFLRLLESDGMCNTKSNTKSTIITIENWGKFQNQQNTKSNTKSNTKATQKQQEQEELRRIKNSGAPPYGGSAPLEDAAEEEDEVKIMTEEEKRERDKARLECMKKAEEIFGRRSIN